MTGFAEIDSQAKMKNIIQETKDYDIFKRMPGNRAISKDLVKDLIRSFTEKPQLVIARPILVNEFFQVVDGQHRKEALVILGRSIPYMVVPKLTINDARLLNALQRSLDLIDFARSYAETNGGDYQKFLDLLDEYHIPPKTMLMYCMGVAGGGGRYGHDFRMGNFKPRDWGYTQEWIDCLSQFEPYLKQWNEQSFALAILRLLCREDYDHDRMLRKLEIYGGRLTHRSGALDYMRDLETIYNSNNPGGKYTRFV